MTAENAKLVLTNAKKFGVKMVNVYEGIQMDFIAVMGKTTYKKLVRDDIGICTACAKLEKLEKYEDNDSLPDCKHCDGGSVEDFPDLIASGIIDFNYEDKEDGITIIDLKEYKMEMKSANKEYDDSLKAEKKKEVESKKAEKKEKLIVNVLNENSAAISDKDIKEVSEINKRNQELELLNKILHDKKVYGIFTFRGEKLDGELLYASSKKELLKLVLNELNQTALTKVENKSFNEKVFEINKSNYLVFENDYQFKF